MSHTKEYRYWQRTIQGHENDFPRTWQDFTVFIQDVPAVSTLLSKIQLAKRDSSAPHSPENSHWVEYSHKPKPYTVNQVVDFWVIQEVLPNHEYICKCVCGVVKQMRGTVLRSGYQSSCGCSPKTRKHPRTKRRLKRVRKPNLEYTWPSRQHE